MGCAEPDDSDVRIGSREAERVSVYSFVDAICGDVTIMVLVHDLCITGARIEMRESRLRTGGVVRLRLPLLPAEQAGEIAWAEGDLAGIRFYQPLNPATFRVLAKAMQLKRETSSDQTDPCAERHLAKGLGTDSGSHHTEFVPGQALR